MSQEAILELGLGWCAPSAPRMDRAGGLLNLMTSKLAWLEFAIELGDNKQMPTHVFAMHDIQNPVLKWDLVVEWTHPFSCLYFVTLGASPTHWRVEL